MKPGLMIPSMIWILLTAVCLILIMNALNKALGKMKWDARFRQKLFAITMVFIIVWVAMLSFLSLSGFFADFNSLPPRTALALPIPLPVILWLVFSGKGSELLSSVPPHWLVFMQSFRIGVEILLFLAFSQGKLPVQMTFEGGNFDILTGLLALPTGYLLMKHKKYSKQLAVVFNIVGMLLLLNILVIAVLSMPTPFRYFMNEPANTLVAQFPFILLPGVLVPIAYGLHIFSLRQLLLKKSKNTKSTEQAVLSHQ